MFFDINDESLMEGITTTIISQARFMCVCLVLKRVKSSIGRPILSNYLATKRNVPKMSKKAPLNHQAAKKKHKWYSL